MKAYQSLASWMPHTFRNATSEYVEVETGGGYWRRYYFDSKKDVRALLKPMQRACTFASITPPATTDPHEIAVALVKAFAFEPYYPTPKGADAL